MSIHETTVMLVDALSSIEQLTRDDLGFDPIVVHSTAADALADFHAGNTDAARSAGDIVMRFAADSVPFALVHVTGALPHRPRAECAIANEIIALARTAALAGFDLGGALAEIGSLRPIVVAA
ncbi:hypothetical protein [Methylobacterium sp. WCS2018Hpa-22]|uniref:hypothetical protein n=1 Tax=Methylobacterium sp. WCS2018Hpa-22 TaxID=3073633 RepID=UPI00288C4F57|nr:hypothetical protein [Methylobacterium sp. WCS2018Hpa-22]